MWEACARNESDDQTTLTRCKRYGGVLFTSETGDAEQAWSHIHLVVAKSRAKDGADAGSNVRTKEAKERGYERYDCVLRITNRSRSEGT